MAISGNQWHTRGVMPDRYFSTYSGSYQWHSAALSGTREESCPIATLVPPWKPCLPAWAGPCVRTACACVRTAWACVRTSVCMHAHLVCACMCMHVRACACMCVHVHACACMCMHVHACAGPSVVSAWLGSGSDPTDPSSRDQAGDDCH